MTRITHRLYERYRNAAAATIAALIGFLTNAGFTSAAYREHDAEGLCLFALLTLISIAFTVHYARKAAHLFGRATNSELHDILHGK